MYYLKCSDGFGTTPYQPTLTLMISRHFQWRIFFSFVVLLTFSVQNFQATGQAIITQGEDGQDFYMIKSFARSYKHKSHQIRLQKHWQGGFEGENVGTRLIFGWEMGRLRYRCFFLLFRTWSHGSCCCGGWLMLSVEDVALRFTHQVACTWPIGYFSWKCNLVRNRYYTKCKNSSTHRLFMIDDWWYAWVFRLFILFCIHVPLVWTLLSLLYVMVNKPILVAGVYNMYTCQKAQWHWSPPHGSDFGGLHAASSTWEHHP